MYEFDLQFDQKYNKEIPDLLEQEGIDTSIRSVQEGLGEVAEVITITSASLVIIDLLYQWIANRKKSGESPYVTIITHNFYIDLYDKKPEEVKKLLEQEKRN